MKIKRGIKLDGETENKDYGYIIDPDSESALLQKIYVLLWDEKMLANFCRDTKKNRYQGETLNSANTTLFKLTGFGIKTSVIKYFGEREKFSAIKNTNFKDFVSVYHTLGNFMPVPVDCNSPRGSINSPVRDHWDLTLKCIKLYYETKNLEWVEKIVGKEYKTVYAKWLDSFGDWENFVNKNYLHAFVEDGTLYPKELWAGHFENWENGGCSAKSALPKTQDQCNEYFENATNLIKKRTVHMLKALEEKLKNGEQQTVEK